MTQINKNMSTTIRKNINHEKKKKSKTSDKQHKPKMKLN